MVSLFFPFVVSLSNHDPSTGSGRTDKKLAERFRRISEVGDMKKGVKDMRSLADVWPDQQIVKQVVSQLPCKRLRLN
ncbi:MAG: hypothetical protein EX330_08375 [Candidatus Brocadia sp. BROELEC01]|nr:hypothetical protein [Candidatus Brocadia sapporoensis]QQR66840.1 MAG: hypothetical protein IPI25_00820 [Candidatus Brocadia sp.]RZV57881.1 MAG: hypothetical protein EX330_08375 [Candidatus Brocadia sp. BROELEC01]